MQASSDPVAGKNASNTNVVAAKWDLEGRGSILPSTLANFYLTSERDLLQWNSLLQNMLFPSHNTQNNLLKWEDKELIKMILNYNQQNKQKKSLYMKCAIFNDINKILPV